MASDSGFEKMLDEVLLVIGEDPSLRSRVVADLKRTGSSEITINNFFEGNLAEAPPEAREIPQSRGSSTSNSLEAPVRKNTILHVLDDDDDDVANAPSFALPRKMANIIEVELRNDEEDGAEIELEDASPVDRVDSLTATAKTANRKKRPRMASLYDQEEAEDERESAGALVRGDTDFDPSPSKRTKKNPADAAVPKKKSKSADNISAASESPKPRGRPAKSSSAGDIAEDAVQVARDKLANIPPKKAKKVSKEDAIAQMRICFDISFVNDARTSSLIQWVQKGNVVASAKDLQRPGVIEWHRSTEQAATKPEPFVLIALSCAKFAEMLKSSTVPAPALGAYIDSMKANYPNAKFLSFAIWGVSEYYAEFQNAQNREYNARAQNDMAKAQKAASEKANLVPKGKIEQSIIWMQVSKLCRLRKFETVGELGNYILKLTEQIAIKPYKPPPAFSTFCAEASGGRQKAARTVGEAWKQALTRINGLSERMAEAITTRFSTMRSLLDMYDRLTPREGEALLASIEVQGDKAVRKIGPAMSKTVYTIFTSMDGQQLIKE